MTNKGGVSQRAWVGRDFSRPVNVDPGAASRGGQSYLSVHDGLCVSGADAGRKTGCNMLVRSFDNDGGSDFYGLVMEWWAGFSRHGMVVCSGCTGEVF